jgi:hypothetical protein
MRKPELQEITDLHALLKGEYSELSAQDTEMAALDAMTYDVPHCEPDIANYTPHVIRSGWTRRAIKSFVAMFATKPIYRHMAGMGATSQRLSEDIEAFLNNVPWAIEARYGAFWLPAVENGGVFGRGWVEVLPKRKRWVGEPDYPKKGKGLNPKTGEPVASDEGADAYKTRREEWKRDRLPPVSMRFLPADQVFALVTEQYRVLKAVRYTEITLAEAGAKWPDKFGDAYDNKENAPTDPVACYEYVDEEWVAQSASHNGGENDQKTTEDFVTQPWRHGMKMCPWILVEALTTASTDPNKRWEPWLREAKDVGIAMDAQLTRKAMISEIWPMPQPHFRLKGPAPEGVEKGYEFIELSSPQALVTYDDTDFAIHPWSQAEPGAEELWQKLFYFMDRSLPNVGSEIAQGSSGTPAWTWRLRGQMLDRDMKTVADNLSLSAKRVGQAILRALLSHWINEPVYFGHKTEKGARVIKVSPDDIAGQVNRIEASVKADKLIDRNSDLGALKLARDMGLPMKWGLEELCGYENPQEIMDEAVLEEIENSEPMKQQLALDVMKRADLLQAQEATMGPEGIAQLQTLGLPGVNAAIMPPMQGLGASGVPVGAQYNTLTRTGVGTATPGGATPFAEGPGEAEVIPT